MSTPTQEAGEAAMLREKIPPKDIQVVLQHGFSVEDVLTMNLEEWREFENFVGNSLLHRTKFEIRRLLQKKKEAMDLEREKEAMAQPHEIDEAIFTRIRQSVHKLFDDDQSVGTFVFIKEDFGVCAFHSVRMKFGIREDTLTVQGQNLKHIASFPFYDLSIYEVPERRGSFLDLEPNASIYVGNQIMLASFPALDSQTQDDEDENVIFTFGRISRREADLDSDLVVAQYLCFPNSSGGAVVSTRGRLIGMHLQAFYHECNRFFKPSRAASTIPIDAAVFSLKWDGGENSSSDDEFADETPGKLARFAASNIQHKGHLGAFLPTSVIKKKLQHAGVIATVPCKIRHRHKRRGDGCNNLRFKIRPNI